LHRLSRLPQRSRLDPQALRIAAENFVQRRHLFCTCRLGARQVQGIASAA
jgi:hypothetical protein